MDTIPYSAIALVQGEGLKYIFCRIIDPESDQILCNTEMLCNLEK